MSNIYNESVHFVGPAEQISLIPAHLEVEALEEEAWLAVQNDEYRNIGQIEEVLSTPFKVFMLVRLHGSPMRNFFEHMSRTFPSVIIMSSSCCPYMGDYYLEAWYGGKPRFWCCIPMFDNNHESIPGVSTPENSILADFWHGMRDAEAAGEASFAAGRKTPRKALRILEQMKTRWVEFELPELDERQKAS